MRCITPVTVPKLKAACEELGLTKGGRKSELVDRILARIAHVEDKVSLSRVLDHFGSTTYLHAAPAAISSNGTTIYLPLRWRKSPFYTVESVLVATKLNVCREHRNTVSSTISWKAEQLALLRGDSNMRVMVYCGERPSPPSSETVDIAFPQQIEIKVNGHDVKANFRGIKKKPGSTNPVDVTAFVRTRDIHGAAKVEITYALTDRIYDVAIVLAKRADVEDLVQKVKAGRVISKERVLQEMKSRAEDDDIVAGPTIMSLKDSVSYLRIQVPCRGTQCKHYNCFDLHSFLEMQKQAPLWTCPICDKHASFENVVLDKYFEDILERAPRNVDSVTVQPDGIWSADAPVSNKRQRDDDSDDSDDDSDDLVVISPPRKRQEGSRPSLGSHAGTPTGTQPRINGTKRNSEVIDLTLDSDDEAPTTNQVTSRLSSSIPPPLSASSQNRNSTNTLSSGGTTQYSPSLPNSFSGFMTNPAYREPVSFSLNSNHGTTTTTNTYDSQGRSQPPTQLPRSFFNFGSGTNFGRMLPNPLPAPSQFGSNRPPIINSPNGMPNDQQSPSSLQFGRPSYRNSTWRPSTSPFEPSGGFGSPEGLEGDDDWTV
jgi:E3 SUMO-protein ligase PIAS1